jgi:hypothetical protein
MSNEVKNGESHIFPNEMNNSLVFLCFQTPHDTEMPLAMTMSTCYGTWMPQVAAHSHSKGDQ